MFYEYYYHLDIQKPSTAYYPSEFLHIHWFHEIEWSIFYKKQAVFFSFFFISLIFFNVLFAIFVFSF